MELQSEDKDGNQHLPVLDLDIHRLSDGSYKFKSYRKSTHTDQYLNFNSHHPLHQKLGIVRTVFDRANTLISTEEDRLAEISSIKAALRLCNYANWTFRQVQKMMKNKKRDQTKKKTPKSESAKTSGKLVALPYAARILKKYDQTVCSDQPAP